MPPKAAAVCKRDDLAPGEIRGILIHGKSLVLVRSLAGTYFAMRNLCPHKGAELEHGVLTGMVSADGVGRYRFSRDGEILRCPWHRFEFDVTTGRSLVDPDKLRVKTYPVTMDSDDVVVHV